MLDINSPHLVPFDNSFAVNNVSCKPAKLESKKHYEKALNKTRKQLKQLQRRFYAHHRYSLLLVFQALDAGGKDSTIREVLLGLDPSGYNVTSFKRPSKQELSQDFLWRTSQHLPARGDFAIFNRSYYEEVLTVKVHPEYLAAQQLPNSIDHETLWQQRYESICTHEEHLARNGTIILKFWLNVSQDEQRNRLLDRLNEPNKNWKFAAGDLVERTFWPEYMHAFETALNATSKPWAPWFAIPADSKPYMRATIAGIIRDALAQLPLEYPTIDDQTIEEFKTTLG